MQWSCFCWRIFADFFQVLFQGSCKSHLTLDTLKTKTISLLVVSFSTQSDLEQELGSHEQPRNTIK